MYSTWAVVVRKAMTRVLEDVFTVKDNNLAIKLVSSSTGNKINQDYLSVEADLKAKFRTKESS